ncbi:related to pisatin demethylase (cytochrome P450) [Cephalotrichum gorgonifer]|uniref:Cytochrome P450 monooxygenase ABA1 n=1 Tax=Cephalotrichum gorgonifer TaxID=2041049 RepID=A0AAE8N4Y6_9PEZI|nr:related to pisatin demethylase (cytochrome P450) [Cephalotrichum gorgonifer]
MSTQVADFAASVLGALQSLRKLPRTTVATGFLGLLAAAFSARVAYRWYRLSHVPGPFWAGISTYWIIRVTLDGVAPYAYKEVTDKYGSLARVGPNDLITDDPELLRKMMAVRSPYSRGSWHGAQKLDPARDNLFSMTDEVAHRDLRAKMAAGYSGKENHSMEATIDSQIANFIDLIERKYLSTGADYRPMDLGEKGQFFTLDVISDLAFGQAFGFLEKDADPFDYVKITKAFIPFMIVLCHSPYLARLLHSPPFKGLFPKGSDKLGFGAFIGVTNKAVAARFKPGAENQLDMLGSFIRHGLTQEEASGEALLQVMAGSDTSATTIRMVLLNLLSTPRAYQRLRKEIDDAIEAGKISSPVKNTEGMELPYLQAVIKEVLRLNPPASGPFFKVVPPGGDVINGLFIPAGTQIGSSPLGIHRSKKRFGEDADTFRPERWLEEEDSDRLAMMHSTVDLVFHYGKYQCLGKPVAMMEFNKIFIELLRRFDFSIANAQKPAEISNFGIWMIENFWVRIERRAV